MSLGIDERDVVEEGAHDSPLERAGSSRGEVERERTNAREVSGDADGNESRCATGAFAH